MVEPSRIEPEPSLTEQLLVSQGEVEEVTEKDTSVVDIGIRSDTYAVVARLFVSGTSPKNIAVTLKLTEDKVKAILKLPEIQPFIKEAISSSGEDVCANLLEATKAENIWTLIELRNNPATPANVRANVCIKLLELTQGKEPIKLEKAKVSRQQSIMDRMNRLEEKLNKPS